MEWLALAGGLLVPLAYWLGRRAGRVAESVMMDLGGPLPPEVAEDRFIVVARLDRGSRARQMYECGEPGAGEVLELWDGATCRGRKIGAPPT